MILHKVALRHWRSYIERHEFFFEEGINLLAGPNEAGKSTLFEAIERAFFGKHGSKTQEMQAIQPIGTTLAPEVEVEFSHEGEEYLVKKTFLKNASSEVRVRRDGEWRKESDGDEADRRIRAILKGSETGSRTAQAEMRGIAQALWCLQKDRGLPEDSWSDAVKGGLIGLVDLAALTSEDELFRKALSRNYGELFTGVLGKFKSGSEPELAKQSEAAAVHKLEELQTLLSEADEIVNDISYHEDQLAIALRSRADARAALAKAEEAIKDVPNIERESARLDQAAKDVVQKAETLESDLRKAEELINSIAAFGKDVQSNIEAKAEAEAKASIALRAKDAARKERIEVIAPALNIATRRRDALLAAARKRQLEKDHQRLTGLQGQIRDASESVKEAQEQLLSKVAPDKAAFDAFCEAERELSNAQIALRSLGASVRFDVSVEVASDQEPAEDGTYFVGGLAKFTLGKIGTVSVETMAPESSEASVRAKQLRDLLERECVKYGVASFEEIHQLWSDRDALERRLADAKIVYNTIVGQQDDFDGELSRITQSLSDETLKVTLVEKEVLNWGGEQIGVAIGEADQTIAQLEADRDRLQEAEEQAGKNHQGQVELSHNLAVRHAELSAARKADESTRDQIISRHGSLDLLRATVSEAKRQAEDAAAKVADFKKDYSERVERPTEEYDQAKIAVQTTEKSVADLEKHISAQDATLKALHLDGLAERIEEAEATWERAVRICARALTKATAIKDIYEATEAVRKSRTDAISRPVAEIVDSWLPRINPKFTSITLDEKLLPDSVSTRDHNDPIPLGSLSYGAHEQIVVLIRLALAWHLGKDKRQMIVLDDRLVNADTVRRKALCGILTQVARDRCQVLLATCNVQDYSVLPGTRIEIPYAGCVATRAE